MVVKDRFELIYKTTGDVYNVVPLSTSTLKAYQVMGADLQYLTNLANTYSRIKEHPTSKLVEKESKKCMVVKFPDYPLPGFITRRGAPITNLSVLPVTQLSDYSSSDIYSLFLYTICLDYFINKKPFDLDGEIHISNYLFSVFMNLFGKKSGLVGAFSDLIPKLRFIIRLYVYASMFGGKLDERAINKLANIPINVDPSELNLNFDFRSTKEFLKAINKNNLIPISENKFSTLVINRAGISSLPLFEDVSRLFATLISSTVVGNRIFSTYWKRVNAPLFDRLVYVGIRSIYIK